MHSKTHPIHTTNLLNFCIQSRARFFAFGIPAAVNYLSYETSVMLATASKSQSLQAQLAQIMEDSIFFKSAKSSLKLF